MQTVSLLRNSFDLLNIHLLKSFLNHLNIAAMDDLHGVSRQHEDATSPVTAMEEATILPSQGGQTTTPPYCKTCRRNKHETTFISHDTANATLPTTSLRIRTQCLMCRLRSGASSRVTDLRDKGMAITDIKAQVCAWGAKAMDKWKEVVRIHGYEIPSGVQVEGEFVSIKLILQDWTRC